jgi:uncharacterized cofD-like protein
MTRRGPAVVGLGGGHGLAATLAAARRYAGDITAVVSVADDGGSSGRLRKEFGIPAPGDVRRCLVELAASRDGAWARAFGMRFDRGSLAGHALGNLVLAALSSTTGSFAGAIEEASSLLGTVGRVLPATAAPVVLTGVRDGQLVEGQTALMDGGGITSVAVSPEGAAAGDGVVEAIEAADQVVLGPGSLFTSVLAVAVVPSIREALAARSGGVVFVCNLRPSKETFGFDVAMHLRALADHGVRPHAALVDPSGIEMGSVGAGCPVVTAALARPNGWSHDVDRLAAALEGLAVDR